MELEAPIGYDAGLLCDQAFLVPGVSANVYDDEAESTGCLDCRLEGYTGWCKSVAIAACPES